MGNGTKDCWQDVEAVVRAVANGFGLSGRLLVCLTAALLVVLGSGCDKSEGKSAPAAAAAEAERRTEDMSWGPVELVFEFDPGKVRYDKDVFLTVRVSAPSEVDVQLPPLPDRLAGFAQSGEFADDPVSENGKRTVTRHYRLTPVVADEYRVAPMAVEYVDRSSNPPERKWFATRPVVLDLVRPESGGLMGAGDIKEVLDPVWIGPAFRTVLMVVLGVVALCGLGVGVWYASRRVRETIQVMRMTPRERAIRELERLLAQDLIGKNQVKDFYVELTMIVRRYIERSHSIRAPEQTTEEFLQAVAGDARFSGDTVRKLRNFLQSADLVKFAAYEPDGRVVDDSVRTAREYIDADAVQGQAAGQAESV